MGQVQTTATNYRDKMKIKSGFALANKADDIVDNFGTTSITRACAWRFGECMGLLCNGKSSKNAWRLHAPVLLLQVLPQKSNMSQDLSSIAPQAGLGFAN